jgi:hypothetical protein
VWYNYAAHRIAGADFMKTRGSKMKLPNRLIQFIEDNSVADCKTEGVRCPKTKCENLLYLPVRYAGINQFSLFQEGYRYNPVTDENLVSDKKGEWQDGWYVFAQNGMDEPFYIDFNEEGIDFPVYFSWHGAGTWEQIKVADSLEHFERIIKAITENEANLPFNLDSLSLGVDLHNDFWSEVNQYCSEEAAEGMIMNKPQIGDIIPFGEYNWRVLEVRDEFGGYPW